MDVSSSSEFVCPRCHVPLKDIRTSGGVFYGCDICGGRAVTIELLRKRFTKNQLTRCGFMRREARDAWPALSIMPAANDQRPFI
jgi:hypothetical protein